MVSERACVTLAGALLGVLLLTGISGVAGLARGGPGLFGSPDRAQASILDRGGEQVYRELCAVCHGDSGRGDGPLAFGMRPTVVDLRYHMAEGHTDEALFEWISNGLPGVPVHAFRGDISEQECWDVIAFIRASFTES
jgi:cytochrome c